MKEHPQLIGKIILAKFLEYSVERFITFVGNIESSQLYRKLVEEGVIMPKPLAGVLCQKGIVASAKSGVIAGVDGTGNFSLYYTAREFSIEYQISDEKLTSYLNSVRPAEAERKNIDSLLNKIRRISARNLIVHRILEKIVEHQRCYFASDNEFNLRPLSQAGLARLISDSENGSHSLDITIDTSRISRALRKLSIITPGEKEIPVSRFFVSRKDMVKKGIKEILNREKKDIGSGRIIKPRTDEELRRIIQEEYGLSVTRREVSYCRKELGISAYSERNGYVYHTLAANFSRVYPFTAPSVEDNAPAGPGVYELCVAEGGLEYPTGYCQAFYIGSANNLRKRLLTHLSSSSQNGGIKKATKEGPCVFRYLRVPLGWDQEEKKFYDLFVLTYGGSPQCNHMSPKVAGKQTDRNRFKPAKGGSRHE